jgi:hypothetical protein
MEKAMMPGGLCVMDDVLVVPSYYYHETTM